MSKRRLTFFELHTHGNVQFGPASLPGIGSDETEEASATDLEAEGDEEGSNSAVKVLIALGVLVAVAAVVRKLRGGESPEVPLAESDDIPATAD